MTCQGPCCCHLSVLSLYSISLYTTVCHTMYLSVLSLYITVEYQQHSIPAAAEVLSCVGDESSGRPVADSGLDPGRVLGRVLGCVLGVLRPLVLSATSRTSCQAKQRQSDRLMLAAHHSFQADPGHS
jgi:hypothetical protein